MSPHPTTLKTYAERIEAHSNATAKKILQTIDRKKSNLCVSVDVTKAADALEVVRRVGASVCMVKVGLRPRTTGGHLELTTDALRHHRHQMQESRREGEGRGRWAKGSCQR